MKIVAIRDMSAGNENVGEMWKETKIFDWQTPVIEIVKWANNENDPTKYKLRKNLIITTAEELEPK